MTPTQIFWTKFSSLIIYLIIVVVLDLLFQDRLFNYSLTAIFNIQQSIPNYFLTYFKIVTYLVYAQVMFPLLLIIFNYCKFQTTYFMVTIFLLASVIDNILKLINRQPRPYMVNPKIINYYCDSDYGNPSGHSFVAFSFYFALLHYIFNNEWLNGKIVLKVIFWIIGIIILFSVSISRIVLGVHAINQILFGGLYGIALYFIFIHILDVQNIKSEEFIPKFANKFFNLIVIGSVLILILFTIILYYSLDYDNRQWELVVDQKCVSKAEWGRFQYFNYGLSLVSFSYIGMHLGWQYFTLSIGLSNVKSYIKIEALNDFNNTSIGISFLRLLLILVVLAIFGVPAAFIPVTNIYSSITFYFVFYLTLIFFVLFFLCSFLNFKLKLLNEELNKKLDDEGGFGNEEEKEKLKGTTNIQL